MTDDSEQPEHVRRNRDLWDVRARDYIAAGERAWAREEPTSEYGACLWADPDRWVPEAARLLRRGGELIFLVNSALLTLCMPAEDGVAATDRLLRPAFDMRRIEWPGDQGVEFHLSHGDWIRVLRRSGFEVEDLIEVRPAESATTTYPYVTVEWARQWPAEEIWRARRR